MASRTANKDRAEIRRKERFNVLHASLVALIDLRSSLQPLQDANTRGEAWAAREMAYGKAYAIMLSLDDSESAENAEIIMKGKEWDSQTQRNEKLDAINFGIRRLGKLLVDTSKSDTL